MQRIERLLNLIAALLGSDRPMTAEDIRTKVAGYEESPTKEAFRRQFERDKADLRDMGIPVETLEVSEFGDEPQAYTIPKGKYYMPDVDLAEDELAALRIVADVALGSAEQARSGIQKISLDSGAAIASPHIVYGADVATEQPLLGPLFEAVIDRAPVAFDYETGAGDRARREVEPYTLLHRRGNWYLVGRDRNRDAPRSFKLSRISGKVTRLEGTFVRPEGFDAAAHAGGEAWEVGAGETVIARVRFLPAIRWWAEQNLAHMPSSSGPDGALDVELPVANVDALVSWVIGFASDAVVVSPPEARRAVADHVAVFLHPR